VKCVTSIIAPKANKCLSFCTTLFHFLSGTLFKLFEEKSAVSAVDYSIKESAVDETTSLQHSLS